MSNDLNEQTVIREVCPNVWTFSTPFARMNLFPIGGRSTAIKLKSGNLWIVASSPLNQVTKDKIEELGGNVGYLVSPDTEHYLFLKQYAKQYPNAKLIGGEHVVKKITDVIFHGVFEANSPVKLHGYEEEIKALYVPGHLNNEIVFLHKESKTLVQADMLFNLPANEQYSKTPKPFLFNQSRYMSPFSGFHRFMAGNVITDKKTLKECVSEIAKWDFERIIPCHGDVVEQDAKKAWRELYRNFIDD